MHNAKNKEVDVRTEPVVTHGALRPATEKRAALHYPKNRNGALRPYPLYIDGAQTCGALRPRCTHIHVYASA